MNRKHFLTVTALVSIPVLLAAAGFDVTATDISPASVQRCAREAANRGVRMTTAVADLRVLDVAGAGDFDAVVSFDNSLPHLLDDTALDAACGALLRVLRPGGAVLASIRDYDELLSEQLSGEPPRRFTTPSGERTRPVPPASWTSRGRCLR